MNSRTTIRLAVVAVLITLLAWWDAGRTEFHFQRDLDQPFRFPASAVRGLEITSQGNVIKLEREGEQWRISSPIEFPASSSAVEVFTSQLKELRVRGEGEGETALGLSTPQEQMLVEVAGRAPAVIQFGDSHPTLPYRYAAIDGEVVLIDPLLGELVEVVTVDDLRETALCDIPPIRVESLTIERPEGSFQVAREGDLWELIEPTTGDAEPEVVRRALEGLNGWGIHSFVADGVFDREELGSYGLAEPELRISVVERGTGRTVSLGVGDRIELPEDGGAGVYLYLEETGTVVRATAALLARLPGTPDAVRSRLLVRVPRPDVVGVTVLGDYRRVDLVRDGRGAWRVSWSADGISVPASSELVATMLESLRGATVERFVDFDSRNLQKYGFDRPVLEIEIRLPGGEKEGVLVGAPVSEGSNQRYVLNPRWTRAGIAVFPDLERWRRAPFTLRSDQVISIPAESMRCVRVSDPEGRSRTYVRPGSTWRLEGSSSDPALSQPLRQALSSLVTLTATRWDPRIPLPPGPEEFALKVEVLPLDGESRRPWTTLWVGTRTSQGRAIRVGDTGWVLIYEASREKDLFSPLDASL